MLNVQKINDLRAVKKLLPQKHVIVMYSCVRSAEQARLSNRGSCI